MAEQPPVADENRFHLRYPGGQPIAVRLAVPEIDPVVSSFYSEYVCPAPLAVDVAPRIELTRERGDYLLSGPSGDWRCSSPGEAVLYYENELAGALLADAVDLVHIHAAALLTDGRCVLLIGPSGAGKSTLSVGLHLRGVTALSDDLALLDPRSGALRAFPRPLRVHIEGLAAIGLAAEDVTGSWLSHPYLWLAPDAEPGSDVVPDMIVFLGGEGDAGVTPLSAAETLAGLLRSRMSVDPVRDFACLRRLAVRARGYRFRHRGLAEAVSDIEELIRV